MTDVPFPLLSWPGGAKPLAAGGRLINCYPEKLPATAGKPYAYWRVPGIDAWGTLPVSAPTAARYRGGIQVDSTFYGLFGDTIYSWTSAGAVGTALTGTIPGTADCFFAANNNSPRDIVVVSPGLGAFIITGGTTIANYPNGSGGFPIGSPNSVVFYRSFFIFTYGNGRVQASKFNSIDITSNDYATAESKPDTLFRAVPLGNGQLLLCGSNTMEVWGGTVNDIAFPFNYISTIYRGPAGAYAIAGNEDGWGKGIYLVGDDNRVSTLTGYAPDPISVPDLDDLIEAEPDKTKITVGCYITRGHGFVVVQGPNWCWEFDTVLSSWHERRSYLKPYWRGDAPINAFGYWLCGDRDSNRLLRIDASFRKETGDPLAMRIETGPFGPFPNAIRVNEIEVYMTKGKSNALGHDPDETNAKIDIWMSRDGGNNWSKPRQVPIGRQAITNLRARSSIWGQAEIQGVRWRFDESAGLDYGFMGADMKSDTLR